MFTSTWLAERLMIWVPLVLSLSVHEWAHAWSAYRLGDDTADRQGRLTLNPIAHIDPLGTFLLPLLGIPFGWAKPVPVNPLRFRRDVTMKTGMMITAAAGPLSNLLIAIVSGLAFGLLWRFGVINDFHSGPAELLTMTMAMNIGLCIFNMLPVPPLDGSRVVDGLLPYRLRPAWEQFANLGRMGILVAIVLGRYVLAGPINWTMSMIYRLVAMVAGVG